MLTASLHPVSRLAAARLLHSYGRRGTCFRCFGNTGDCMNARAIKPLKRGSMKVLAWTGEDLGEGER